MASLSTITPPIPRPYDLEISDPEEFRRALSGLAQDFLRDLEPIAGDQIDGHVALLSSGEEDAIRSRGEYAVELLSFGLLRREYGALCRGTSDDILLRLAHLWEVRSIDASRKVEADRERGHLFREILSYPDGSVEDGDDERLVEWLAATGEFVQEAMRLRLWLRTGEVFGMDGIRQAADGLAEWFLPRAATALGRWTTGVEAFREAVMGSGEAREDLFLVTRREALYHLNMLGSEVMNHGFLPGYSHRPGRVVLVPGCMRAREESACRARRNGLDITCSRCHGECEVAALDRLGESHGFRVFVVPHASTFTAWLRHWTHDDQTALIAIACPLHLVTGGYEMRDLGLEAQCLMLQFSGCRRHWVPGGVPTRVDRAHLLEVVRRGT
ncbi:MAG: DUF116 domain-containing protein [Fibrobacteria bacterium]|nr:DUF116 domain-containing protein [Fibrobacteria bacterium]